MKLILVGALSLIVKSFEDLILIYIGLEREVLTI